jgi:hypothetical protein
VRKNRKHFTCRSQICMEGGLVAAFDTDGVRM